MFVHSKFGSPSDNAKLLHSDLLKIQSGSFELMAALAPFWHGVDATISITYHDLFFALQLLQFADFFKCRGPETLFKNSRNDNHHLIFGYLVVFQAPTCHAA